MENSILLKTKSIAIKNNDIAIRKTVLLPGLIVFSQFYFFQPLLPLLSKTMGISLTRSSFAMSFTMIGLALGLFTAIFFVDRFPRKKIMIRSLFFSSIITITSAFSWNFQILVALNFIKGFLVSGILSVGLAYISEEVTASKRGVIIGVYLAGNVLGGMFGRVIASIISDIYTWRIAVLFLGFIGLLLLVPFVKHFPVSQHFSPKKESLLKKITQLKVLLKSFSFLRLILIIVLNMGVFVSVYNYLSFRLKVAPFLLSQQLISILFMLYIIGALGPIFIGKLSQRIAPIQLLKITIPLFLQDFYVCSQQIFGLLFLDYYC